MILKIWQCKPHKDARTELGITSLPIGMGQLNEADNDCPFCIIDTQANQIKQLQKELEYANTIANCV